jgi:mannosylglycerate hydrolase
MLHPRSSGTVARTTDTLRTLSRVSQRVAVVAHTHWDREWYSPFESFRIRLVGVVDRLLDLLEADPSFEHFLLDGQTAAIDDYLEVRPGAAARIRRLVESGRLAIGPWYVLLDEFCVSGETIIRNLQLGMARASELGGPMAVGYLPDMFGHVAQMPQVLREACLAHAVVWRGVPAVVDRPGFWWQAPDGSTVRAEFLPVGYANGAFLPSDPDALIRRLEAYTTEVETKLGPVRGPLLLMNGGDHQAPQAGMPALLEAANKRQAKFQLEQASLEAYLDSAPTDDLQVWAGELRSGARSNVLMGVLSNRMDIKVAAAVAERSLERLAEPLAALWLTPDLWPSRPLDDAWLAVIRNSAHDSVCGCSADEVSRAVIHRYDQAGALAREVVDRALDLAGVATVATGPVVVNPAARDRQGMVELVLSGAEAPAGTQVLAVTPAGVEERRGAGRDLGRLLGELARDGWLGGTGRAVDARLESGLTVVLTEDATAIPSPAMASIMAEAWAQAGGAEQVTVRVERRPSQRVLARTGPVPGYGWAAWAPLPASNRATARAGAGWLENDRLRVEVDPDTGTFSINGVAGLDRLIDEGDDGDTYNWSPPAAPRGFDEPVRVDTVIRETGPVRARLKVQRRYRVGGCDRPVDAVFITLLELRAGEAMVRVTTSFVNGWTDHRLRAWFPLPEQIDHTVAECAFGMTSRKAVAEGGPHEWPVPAYPSRRFVQAGRLTVTHEGLLEHELTGEGTVLAVTLLRSVGVLAKPAPASRPNVAGPPIPLEGTRMLGPQTARYAVALDVEDPWALAEDAWVPLMVVRSGGAGRLPVSGSRLRVRGAEVSALYRKDGRLEVRVFNPRDEAATVEIPGHSGFLVDLLGNPGLRWQGRFGLRPWGVATARLDATALD